MIKFSLDCGICNELNGFGTNLALIYKKVEYIQNIHRYDLQNPESGEKLTSNLFFLNEGAFLFPIQKRLLLYMKKGDGALTDLGDGLRRDLANSLPNKACIRHTVASWILWAQQTVLYYLLSRQRLHE